MKLGQSNWTKALKLLLVFASVTPFAIAFAQSDESISRDVLVDMAKSQYDTLCASNAFASCMGFTGSQCQDLANAAITQCLLPLPESIATVDLDNAVIESCPAQVFADAGFTEEDANVCFDAAMAEETKQ